MLLIKFAKKKNKSPGGGGIIMFAIGFRGLFTLILLCEFKKFESSRGGGRGPEPDPLPFLSRSEHETVIIVHTFNHIHVVFCEIQAVLILMPVVFCPILHYIVLNVQIRNPILTQSYHGSTNYGISKNHNSCTSQLNCVISRCILQHEVRIGLLSLNYLVINHLHVQIYMYMFMDILLSTIINRSFFMAFE